MSLDGALSAGNVQFQFAESRSQFFEDDQRLGLGRGFAAHLDKLAATVSSSSQPSIKLSDCSSRVLVADNDDRRVIGAAKRVDRTRISPASGTSTVAAVAMLIAHGLPN